jgi:fructose-specific phosphotransferase system component IIB
MLGIVVFHLKIHQNNFFRKKIIFKNSTSKWFENTKKYLFKAKKKNKKILNYFKSAFKMQKQVEW